MSSILVVGQDEALLEGLAQMLAHEGFAVQTARNAPDAVDLAASRRPLVAVVERKTAVAHPELGRLPLDAGGALLIYDLGEQVLEPLPASVQRLVLAELRLPLERHRLVALVHRVEERVEVTGRRSTHPPERHAE
jgi:DNA-binding NtrC family response regulator